MVMVRASSSVVSKAAKVAKSKSTGPTWPNGKVSGKTKTPKAEKAPKVKKPKAEPVDKTGYSTGMTTGMQVHEYWGLLLGNQAKAHLSDAELEAAVRKEFPKRDKVQPASRLRGWYNCGTYIRMGLAPGGKKGEVNGVHPEYKCLNYLHGEALNVPRPEKDPIAENAAKKKAAKKAAAKK